MRSIRMIQVSTPDLEFLRKIALTSGKASPADIRFSLGYEFRRGSLVEDFLCYSSKGFFPCRVSLIKSYLVMVYFTVA
jgi:hypothetical protein